MTEHPYATFVPLPGFPATECQMHVAAITIVHGHGPVIADVDVACWHEHVTKDVPCCAECLDQHVQDPLCCSSCELLPHLRGASHCCPLTLEVHVR